MRKEVKTEQILEPYLENKIHLPTITLSPGLNSPSELSYDKSKENWKLLSDVNFYKPIAVEFHFFLASAFQPAIPGKKLILLGEELGNLLGQRHLEQLIANQKQIPEALKGNVPLFIGTIWENLNHSGPTTGSHYKYIPSMYLDHDGIWKMGFYGLEEYFSSRNPIALAKTL